MSDNERQPPEGSASLVPGLEYHRAFISDAAERILLANIADIPANWWIHPVMRGVAAKRSSACFGFRYVASGRRLEPAVPFSDWLSRIADRAAIAANIPSASLNQVLVTRYPRGAGIGVHRDAPFFGDVVTSLSLCAPCRMIFRKDRVRFVLELAPRSLLVLRGEARLHWTHEIPRSSVRTDRLSITFRQVPP